VGAEDLSIFDVCRTPDTPEQCVVRQQPPAVAYEGAEQLVLDRRQPDLSGALTHDPSRQVNI
jgi:hypothetical protein